MTQDNQPTVGAYGQPDHTLVRSILDTWFEEWGVKELWENLDLNHYRSYEAYRDAIITFHQPIWQQVGHSEPQARPMLEAKLQTYLQEHEIVLPEPDQEQLLHALLAELYGLGPLEWLLRDEEVGSIIINGPEEILVMRQGRRGRVNVDVTFEHMNHLLYHLNQIFGTMGKLVNRFFPIAQERLRDGSLVCAVVPPVAFDKPSVTIQKFWEDWLTMDDLLRFKSVSPEMADFLSALMKTNLNVIVAGSTRMGSGKTTVLNILTSFLRDRERIVTVEEIASIQVRQAHVISLESRPPNPDGTGAITLQDLLQTATWLSPDRMIVGELQGPEVLEVLRLMERGYALMTLLHAESHEQALDRLEMLVKFHQPELPTPYLRAFIGSAVDLIVQTNRLSDGSRKITSMVEVQPVRNGDYAIHPIFTFQQTGTDERGKIVGEFRFHQVSERLHQRFQSYGIFLPGLMRAEDE